MSKRKIAYMFGAVSVTSASAFVYGLKNKSFDKWFPDDKEKISQGTITINSDNHNSQAIVKARDLVLRYKDEIGAPGLVIGVSVNGKTVWAEGVGMADVENRVPCHSGTVMRIASISKSMTMAVVAKLWEEGKIDFDKPVQEYVPHFPVKTFDNKEVEITTRLLASHLAGIRHYTKKGEKDSENALSDTAFKEFYLMDKFESVDQALKLFQDDELMSEPGTSYHYTTHGWTLISAVVEGAAKTSFPKLMTQFFKTMGMKNTCLDENDPIIYNRSRYYTRNKKGRLTNVPYADNSYKWAGGGFVSTVGDLLHFCNAMLLSYQHSDKNGTVGNATYLQPQTVQTLWTPHPVTQKPTTSWGRDGGYGMGWFVVPQRNEFKGGDEQTFSVGHSGGAVGASSVILVIPHHSATKPPCGVAVAIITNLQDVGLYKLASEVAQLFNSTDS